MTRAATVTAERIEKALDGPAGIIAAAGEAGARVSADLRPARTRASRDERRG